ncbi:MAG: hypothetical protein LIP28_04780 [Deltaproteobacteria bacterium]|nr:hypothetical protein [Deltaproteobacteria bacterium]
MVGNKGAGMTSVPRLHSRLRSCLQAILELEPELKTLRAAGPLLSEFTVLKDIYNRLETLLVQEEDVKRIEEATANFFEELKGSIKQEAVVRSDQRYLQ